MARGEMEKGGAEDSHGNGDYIKATQLNGGRMNERFYDYLH